MPDRDTLDITLPSGGIRIGAIVILAMGCVILAMFAEPADAAPGFRLSTAGMVVAAVLVLGVLYMLLIRRGIRFDRHAGHYSRWSGPLLPLFQQKIPLPEGPYVEILVERRRARNRTGGSSTTEYRVYAVRLQGAAGAGPVIREFPDSTPARALAESICKYLQCDLHDSSHGDTVVREAAYLDESIGDRYRRLGLKAEAPGRVAGARAKTRRSEGATVIDIPASGFGRAQAILLLVIAVGALPVAGFLGLFAGAGGLGAGGILALLMLLAAAAHGLRLALYREEIQVSGDGVRVRQGAVLRSWQQLPASAIEEVISPLHLENMLKAGASGREVEQKLREAEPWINKAMNFMHDLGFSGEILLRTDAGNLGLGWRLPMAQKVWLRDLLIHALVAPSAASVGGVQRAGGLQQTRLVDGRRQLKFIGVAVVVAGIAAYSLDLPERFDVFLSAGSFSEPPQPPLDTSAYLLQATDEAHYIAIYGNGMRVEANGNDLRIDLQDIVLKRRGEHRKMGFENFSAELWGFVDGNLGRVDEQSLQPSTGLIRSGRYLVAPPGQQLDFPGRAEFCRAMACYLRLRVQLVTDTGAMGWTDATQLLPFVTSSGAFGAQ